MSQEKVPEGKGGWRRDPRTKPGASEAWHLRAAAPLPGAGLHLWSASGAAWPGRPRSAPHDNTDYGAPSLLGPGLCPCHLIPSQTALHSMTPPRSREATKQGQAALTLLSTWHRWALMPAWLWDPTCAALRGSLFPPAAWLPSGRGWGEQGTEAGETERRGSGEWSTAADPRLEKVILKNVSQ